MLLPPGDGAPNVLVFGPLRGTKVVFLRSAFLRRGGSR